MPDMLIIDVQALLDTSKAGADAAKALRREWDEAKALPEDRQRTLLAQLEERRDNLRKALLTRARPVLAEVAKKKGARVVLEKGAVLWSGEQVEDVTATVIQQVDALGPLVAG